MTDTRDKRNKLNPNGVCFSVSISVKALIFSAQWNNICIRK